MTHGRLLDIAVREFGQHGLDGASTRAIAKAAGTAMSSITYHYGSKEGLYLAAADHIAARMADEMASIPAAGQDVGADDRIGARAAVHSLWQGVVDAMAADETRDWSLFIMREQLTPGDGFDRIWAGMMGAMLRRMADLIATATGAAAPAARVTALLLLGQALTVRSCHAALLRLCEVDSLDQATLSHVKTRIGANVDAILDRMIAEETP